MYSLVLETTATERGLRLGTGIEPALASCMPIVAFCQKNSRYRSTISSIRSKNTTAVTNPVFPGC